MNRYALIILAILMTSWIDRCKDCNEDSKLSYQIIERVSVILGERYQMSLGSVGLGREKSVIKTIEASYDRQQGAVSLDEGRRMIVDCVEEYLLAINSDEKLRPFLIEYPFKPENVEISISNLEKDGSNVFDPNIEVFSTVMGKIYYNTRDSNSPYRYKSETNEIYAEAQAILESQKKEHFDEPV